MGNWTQGQIFSDKKGILTHVHAGPSKAWKSADKSYETDLHLIIPSTETLTAAW